MAVIALMLVYPTTTPAATPEKQTTPAMEILTPRTGDGIAYTESGDDGDADDLAGLKDKKRRPDESSPYDYEIRLRSWAKVWRMYFFTFRLYR